MKKEYIIVGAIGIIVMSIFSLFAGYALGKKSRCAVNVEQPVVEKKETALPVTNEGDVPSISPDVPSVSGTLREIRDNGELVIETPILIPASLLPEESTIKTEMITASTGPDTEFMQTRYVSSSSAGLLMEEAKISLSAFKIGDHVAVTSAENTEGQKTIVAIRVKRSVAGTEDPVDD